MKVVKQGINNAKYLHINQVFSIDHQSTSNDRLKPVMTTGLVNVIGIGIQHTSIALRESRLLQRRGRVFAFRSCGPGSIPTSGIRDFSAPCDIWWPVWVILPRLCSRDRYITYFYCLAVEAGFYSDVVECLPLDPAAQVRFPPRAVGIFLHPVTSICIFWPVDCQP